MFLNAEIHSQMGFDGQMIQETVKAVSKVKCKTWV